MAGERREGRGLAGADGAGEADEQRPAAGLRALGGVVVGVGASASASASSSASASASASSTAASSSDDGARLGSSTSASALALDLGLGLDLGDGLGLDRARPRASTSTTARLDRRPRPRRPQPRRSADLGAVATGLHALEPSFSAVASSARRRPRRRPASAPAVESSLVRGRAPRRRRRRRRGRARARAPAPPRLSSRAAGVRLGAARLVAARRRQERRLAGHQRDRRLCVLVLQHALHGQREAAPLGVDVDDLRHDVSPWLTTSRGFSTWCAASSEMCTRPSTPCRISTKAPNVTTFVTRP